MRVIGYVRVSDVGDREGERFISPSEQRATIERFVAAKRHELVDVVEDMNESGRTLDRPGLSDALRRLEEGEADAIAVAYLSRLSRRTVDGLELVQRLNGGGRDVLIADLDLDTSSPVGRAVLTVLLAFAQLESDQRRETYAIAQERAMKRGVYPGSTPTGYAREPDGRLAPDPVAAPAIVNLFERRAKGGSWTELAAQLDRELPRKDGAPWRASTVATLIRTPMYLGRLERTVGGERLVVEDTHEPLVSRALYEAANASAPRAPSRLAEPALLAGLLRCAGCGSPMSRGSGGYKRNASGEKVRYEAYVCLRRCNSAAKMSVPALDRHVLAEALDRLRASEAADASRPADADVEATERAFHRAERELADYLSAISVGDVGPAAFAEGARVRREQVDEARAAFTRAAQRAGVAPSHQDAIEILGGEAGDGAKNVVLRTLIDSVVVSKSGTAGRRGAASERAAISWSEQVADDLAQPLEDVRGERDAIAA
jgi:site-specific DNA recombinase